MTKLFAAAGVDGVRWCCDTWRDLDSVKEMFNFFPKAWTLLPYLNFVVALSALYVQTRLLLPFHAKIEEALEKVRSDGHGLIQSYHGRHLGNLYRLEKSVEELQSNLNKRCLQTTNKWSGSVTNGAATASTVIDESGGGCNN